MTLNFRSCARHGRCRGDPPCRIEVTGWSVDTRTQNPGDVYLCAARAELTTGTISWTAALEKGAAAVVVEHAERACRGELRRAGHAGAPCRTLARWARHAVGRDG